MPYFICFISLFFPLNWDTLLPFPEAVQRNFFQLILESKPLQVKNVTGASPLLWFIRFGDPGWVSGFEFNSRTALNLPDESGVTPLMAACEKKNPRLVRKLLGSGADPFARDFRLKTPLHLAARSGNLEILEILLRRGASPDDFDALGITPLHEAINSGKVPVLETLLDWGGDIFKKNPNSETTPFRLAVLNNRVKAIKVFLTRHLVRFDNPASFMGFNLFDLCREGKLGMVSLFFEQGFFPGQVFSREQQHIIFYAAKGNDPLPMLRLLKTKNQKIGIKNSRGQTLLHVLSGRAPAPLIRWLVSEIPSHDFPDDFKRTPLQYAIENGNREAISELILTGSVPWRRNENNEFPLVSLIKKGDFQTFSHLFQLNRVGADYGKDLHRIFTLACQSGRWDFIGFLIDQGVSANEKISPTGSTALMEAVKFGRTSLAMELLEKGGDPLQLDSTGENALSQTCRTGNLSLLKKMIEKKVPPDGISGMLFSPCEIAVNFKKFSLAKELLLCGASLNRFPHPNPGELLFFEGIQAGALDFCDYLISLGISVDSTNPKGWTPLHYACSRGDEESVKFLIRRGTRAFSQKTEKGFTPLHLAVGANSKSICSQILFHEPKSLLEKDSFGRSALSLAAENCNPDLVEFFLNRGLDVEERGKDGMTPLLRVCLGPPKPNPGKGRVGPYGKEPEQLDSTGTPSILHPDESIRIKTIESLLKNGANPRAGDSVGYTPIHGAAGWGNVEALSLLLENSPGIPHTTTSEGYSPLFEAAFHGKISSLDFLILKGESVLAKTTLGETPISRAIEAGQVGAVKFLIENGGLKAFSPLDFKKGNYQPTGYYSGGAAALGFRTLGGVKEGKVFPGFPLHIAALKGNPEIAKELIKGGCQVFLLDEKGNTPLMVNSRNWFSPRFLKELLNGGADLTEGWERGNNPLLLFWRTGAFQNLEPFLQIGFDINQSLPGKNTPLHHLMKINNGYTYGTEILLKNKGDFTRFNSEGLTPFHIACLYQNTEVVDILLKSGIDINLLTKDGKNALALLVEKPCQPMEIFLRNKGCVYRDLKKEEKRNLELALFVASRFGDLEGLKQALKMGANPDAKDEKGDSALALSVEYGHVPIFKELLSSGASMEKPVPGFYHRSILHYAVSLDRKQMIEILLNRGMDINFSPDWSPPPLAIALERGNIPLARLLILKGAKVQFRDKNGKTSLDYAQAPEVKSFLKDLLEGSDSKKREGEK